MLNYVRAYLPFWFPLVAGIGLMIAELYTPDWVMVLLMCTVLIGHVWLTGRVVEARVAHERQDAFSTFLRAMASVARRTQTRSSQEPRSDSDQPQG